MKHLFLLCLIVVALASPPEYLDAKVLEKVGGKITFSDDFNTFSWYGKGGTWKTWFAYGSSPTDTNGRTLSNTELEFYSDSLVGEDPFSASNSILHITANKGNNLPKNDKGVQLLYTSGLITTEPSFKQIYGYFEMQAKLPWGKGFWPAFWLLAVDKAWPPEIDPLEAFGAPNSRNEGHNNQIHHGCIGTDGSWGEWTNTTNNVNITAGFHVYAALWTQLTITFYFDGVQTQTGPTPAALVDREMYLLANLAVGGGWPENPDSSTPFPAQMEIDYINVYSLNGTIFEFM